MPLTYQEEEWLKASGYKYHSFISWPHTKDKDVSAFARHVKDDIESSLAGLIADPQVFLDESVFTAGDNWSIALREALCHSLSMVAVCAPMYYHPKHIWCGLEWAAMNALGQARLQGNNFGAIIPVIARSRGPLPNAVSAIQYFDFSNVMTYSNNPFKTNEYKRMINQIANKIIDIAEAVAVNQHMPECEAFQVPTVSAFSGYEPRDQPSPFRRR